MLAAFSTGRAFSAEQSKPRTGKSAGKKTSPEKEKNAPLFRVRSDAWSATDAVGRSLPGIQQTGPLKRNRFVAIFYWIWHVGHHTANPPLNIELTTRCYPESVNDYDHPVWKRIDKTVAHHWNKPLFGYYRSTDAWVCRKHAEMLADAGVDVIVFDATNASLTWKEAYEVLLPVFSEARKQGVRTPQFAFMLPFGPYSNSLVSIKQLYRDIYKPGRFKDLWFFWKGKPLIMAYPDNVPEPMKSFFTFRPGQPKYRGGPRRKDHWGWLEMYPQNGYGKSKEGRCEEMTVGVAQNATSTLWPAAMNDKNEVLGRGYTHKHGPNHSAEAIARGLNFQEQWNRAIKLDPELIFVTGWNEWVAGRFKKWQKTENAFPDQFNNEYSRDIEPMEGGFGDNYYYQLIANIRRYKGLKATHAPSAKQTIRMGKDWKQWNTVLPVFEDHRGDTMARNHPGYGRKIRYHNNTGRNDFIELRVARDKIHIYFYAKTAAPIISPKGEHWMLLLLDMDRNRKTGWKGYDFILNRSRRDNKPLLEFSAGSWVWQEVGAAEGRIEKNQLEIAVPRKFLAHADKELNFEFKWVDVQNCQGEIPDFYQYGDAAPAGRFNYVFRDIGVRKETAAP